MKFFKLLIFIFITSCSSTMQIDKFKNAKPEFFLEDYFSGKVKAWGLFHDRFGNLKRTFEVDINGTLKSDLLVLDEKFLYDDGEKEQRIWKIKLLGEKQYSGTADDVVGKALGKASGNALNWTYKLNLKIKDSTIMVDFDDWMFLQDNKVLMNRAEVKKWGVTLGVVTITFLKL